MAKEQYGSRKRKAAIHHTLNKRLTFNILQQQRVKVGVYSCDLKSCYDRIVHYFASLSMRRIGAAESSTVSMFSTVQKLRKHTVGTAFRYPDLLYSGEEWRNLEVLMGIGHETGQLPGPLSV